jgi:hypothetical protein
MVDGLNVAEMGDAAGFGPSGEFSGPSPDHVHRGILS